MNKKKKVRVSCNIHHAARFRFCGARVGALLTDSGLLAANANHRNGRTDDEPLVWCRTVLTVGEMVGKWKKSFNPLCCSSARPGVLRALQKRNRDKSRTDESRSVHRCTCYGNNSVSFLSAMMSNLPRVSSNPRVSTDHARGLAHISVTWRNMSSCDDWMRERPKNR